MLAARAGCVSAVGGVPRVHAQREDRLAAEHARLTAQRGHRGSQCKSSTRHACNKDQQRAKLAGGQCGVHQYECAARDERSHRWSTCSKRSREHDPGSSFR